MRFSIPTETGPGKGSIERRAALSPAGVHELCLTGAEVFVQQHAGRGAGFTDEAYRTAGAGVVTTRGDVHYVVTEFGVAQLYGKTLRQRARALIDIAHPQFRDSLERAAQERKLL